MRVRGAVNRRVLLMSMAGGSLLSPLVVALNGCGGGKKKDASPTRGIKITVAPELAGTDRRLHSAYAMPKNLNADGTVETTISRTGAQLLTLTDDSGLARGFVIITGEGSVTLDATSTATALLFLTPGVLTTDTVEAAERLAQLRSLPTVPAWTAYLRDRLANIPLRDLRNDPEAETLRTACLAEWQNSTRTWQSDFARFQADFSGSDSIELESGAWRDAVLLRERLESNLRVVSEPRPVIAPMEGAVPNTWGRLFSTAGFSTGRRYDRPEVNGDPPVGLIRYTLYGPGRAGEGVTIPEPLAAQDPYTSGVFYLAALPLMDLVYGTTTCLSRGWIKARDVLAQSAPTLDVATVRDATRAGSANAAASALAPAVESALSGAATIAAAYGLVGEGKLALPASPDLVPTVAATLGASNFRFVAQAWVDYPEISVYDVPVTSGEVVVR